MADGRERQVSGHQRLAIRRYSNLLIGELAKKGIVARVEKELQDLLAEPAVTSILTFLRLAIMPRNPDAWAEVTETCLDLWGVDAGSAHARDVERKLSKARQIIGQMVELSDGKQASVLLVLNQILDIFGERAVKQAFPQYRQGTYLADLIEQAADQLARRIEQPMTWLEALDDLEGVESIPVMTVHKSKGLEYHTVVFVGLEDSSLWNFQTSPDEEKCGFFVAFSRAIKNVVFTFAQYRPRTAGGTPEKQSRSKIGVLYSLLEEAGIVAEAIN